MTIIKNSFKLLDFQCEKSPLDEACCQELMEERNAEYNEEFEGLHETLDILKQNIRESFYYYE